MVAAIHPTNAGHADSAPLDVAGLQGLLKKRVADPPAAEMPLPERRVSGDRRTTSGLAALLRRAIKPTVALAALVAFGFAPVRNLIQSSSVEAVVTAQVVAVRSPIDGFIEPDAQPLRLGEVANLGQRVFVVKNPRADSARLDDLRRAIDHLSDDRAALASRLDAARAALANAKAQLAVFRGGRLRELDARMAAMNAELAAARAKRLEAEELNTRIHQLASKEFASPVEAIRAQTVEAVARAAETAADRQVEALAVERDATIAGSFVGDAYNDRPSSAQRVDELEQRIVELESELGACDAQFKRLRDEEAGEARKAELNASTFVVAPTRGRVFELLAAPGEEVRKGQDLARLVDCSKMLVTATVSERVYDTLAIGGRARFRPTGLTHELPGVVANLSGGAVDNAGMAVPPTGAFKESYRVTVAVPALDSAGECAVGRTGQVLFDPPASTVTQ